VPKVHPTFRIGSIAQRANELLNESFLNKGSTPWFHPFLKDFTYYSIDLCYTKIWIQGVHPKVQVQCLIEIIKWKWHLSCGTTFLPNLDDTYSQGINKVFMLGSNIKYESKVHLGWVYIIVQTKETSRLSKCW
jgi:hypothetical protein